MVLTLFRNRSLFLRLLVFMLFYQILGFNKYDSMYE
jgi:hypothetical protein